MAATQPASINDLVWGWPTLFCRTERPWVAPCTGKARLKRRLRFSRAKTHRRHETRNALSRSTLVANYPGEHLIPPDIKKWAYYLHYTCMRHSSAINRHKASAFSLLLIIFVNWHKRSHTHLSWKAQISLNYDCLRSDANLGEDPGVFRTQLRFHGHFAKKRIYKNECTHTSGML